MAKGDVKSHRGRGGRGGSGGYGYDDEGRGRSKASWEHFEASYRNNNFDCSWLFGLSDKYIYDYIRATTWRYSVADGPRVWTGDYSVDGRDGDWLDQRHAKDDSRMARIIKKHCGDDVWLNFSKHVTEAWARHHAVLMEMGAERERKRKREWEASKGQRDARDARRLEIRAEKTREVRDEVELTAGLLRSDFADVFRWREMYGQREGDWLDDPVAAYATGYGFGEEIRERSGVKLQITVSIDLSNSMVHNGINEIAVDAFRTIYMAVKSLQQEHPGDLYVAPFEFSGGETGRHAMQVKANTWRDKDEYDLGEMELWRNTAHVSFDGEDTWMCPLFKAIERWENENSDPGAIRLDIVITDAVLEHPKDIREASKIQERRDGNLQTVLLNLMSEEDWLDTTLPLKCIQYPANRENLAGLLRNVLAQFVSVHV